MHIAQIALPDKRPDPSARCFSPHVHIADLPIIAEAVWCNARLLRLMASGELGMSRRSVERIADRLEGAVIGILAAEVAGLVAVASGELGA